MTSRFLQIPRRHRKIAEDCLKITEAYWIYKDDLNGFKEVVLQKRNHSNKIYSLHERDVYCISKGKDYKKHESGSKVSIAMTKTSGIIVSVLNFETNCYVAQTLPEVLTDMETSRGVRAGSAIIDHG